MVNYHRPKWKSNISKGVKNKNAIDQNGMIEDKIRHFEKIKVQNRCSITTYLISYVLTESVNTRYKDHLKAS